MKGSYSLNRNHQINPWPGGMSNKIKLKLSFDVICSHVPNLNRKLQQVEVMMSKHLHLECLRTLPVPFTFPTTLSSPVHKCIIQVSSPTTSYSRCPNSVDVAAPVLPIPRPCCSASTVEVSTVSTASSAPGRSWWARRRPGGMRWVMSFIFKKKGVETRRVQGSRSSLLCTYHGGITSRSTRWQCVNLKEKRFILFS